MIYFSCICIASLLAMAAQKRDSKRLIFMVALILSLLCGLRGDSVGVDTMNYMRYLQNLQSSGIGFGSDIGFSAFAYVLLKIFNDYHIILLICAILTNYLIVFRLWDFRDKASMALMIFIFAVIQYPYTFNIVRQFLAIALIFWGTRYLDRGKTWGYVLINILTASIHTSSLACFSIIFLKNSRGENRRRKKYMWCMLSVLFVVIGFATFSTNIQKYEQHLATVSYSFHGLTLIRFLSAALVIAANRALNNSEFSVSLEGENVALNKDIIYLYLLGLLTAGIGMFFPFMNRIGFYFLTFEMPFWGQTVYAKANRGVYRCMIAVILIYVLSATLFGDSEGLINYTTFLKSGGI